MRVGVDEVGRGCWAGPLVAAAVVLRDPIEGLTDSKLLTRVQRLNLARLIRQRASKVGIGWVSASFVDEHGLTAATTEAMTLAVNSLQLEPTEIIVDGNLNYLSQLAGSQAVIKADLTHPEVSAASIVAKVARDNYMTELARMFPEYGFEQHVGYGTALHRQALAKHGACKLHRQSYKPVASLIA